MGSEVFDAIVVGAGVEGSASAYSLVKQGQRVLLLEQFFLPHSRGSSHGQSRIIRYAYSEDYYTRMMLEAFPLWDTLAREAGTQLFKPCGVLSLGHPSGQFLTSISGAMDRHSIPQERIPHRCLVQRYPMLKYPPTTEGILDPKGGLLMADKALMAFQKVFQQLGGVLRDGEPVSAITPGQPLVTVTTTKGQYRAKRVVVATGPWTAPLMKPLGLHLPFQPKRVTVMYWQETKKGSHASDRFPCLIDGEADDEGQHVYALPSEEYPGFVKVCLHTGPAIDPDNRDDADDSWVRKQMANYVQDHLPWLRPIPGIVETCVYTNTPDHNAVIDFHPQYQNIIIAAGFSGHGFKLAPVVGKVATELALGRRLSHNLEPFSATRFTQSPTPSKL